MAQRYGKICHLCLLFTLRKYLVVVNWCSLIRPIFFFQLPPKPQTLQGYASRVERKRFQTVAPSISSTLAETPKPAAPRRSSTQKIQRMPQVNDEWITTLTDCLRCLVFTLFGLTVRPPGPFTLPQERLKEISWHKHPPGPEVRLIPTRWSRVTVTSPKPFFWP